MANPLMEKFWDQVIQANKALPKELAHLVLKTVRLLGRGQPVSAEQAAQAAGVPQEKTQAIFEQLQAARSAEFDDLGRVTGINGLSINPTPTRFRVGHRALYAWCAMDTLGLPFLLGETAVAEAACPITKQTIRLTVSPEKVESADPPEVVLSVVSPGAGLPADCDPTKLVGSQGSLCASIRFFASRAAADSWLADHPGGEIFTVEEAHEFARRLYESLEIPT